MASGLVVGVASGEYGESTAGSVGVGVGALIETNLRYHNETCLIPGRRDPNPHCDSLSKM